MATKFFQVTKSEHVDDCSASEIEYIGISDEELARIYSKLKELREIEAVKDCFEINFLDSLDYQFYDEDRNVLDDVDFTEERVEVRYFVGGIGSIGFRSYEKYTDGYLAADILCLEGDKVRLHDIESA